eukprot:RCo043241
MSQTPKPPAEKRYWAGLSAFVRASLQNRYEACVQCFDKSSTDLEKVRKETAERLNSRCSGVVESTTRWMNAVQWISDRYKDRKENAEITNLVGILEQGRVEMAKAMQELNEWRMVAQGSPQLPTLSTIPPVLEDHALVTYVMEVVEQIEGSVLISERENIEGLLNEVLRRKLVSRELLSQLPETRQWVKYVPRAPKPPPQPPVADTLGEILRQLKMGRGPLVEPPRGGNAQQGTGTTMTGVARATPSSSTESAVPKAAPETVPKLRPALVQHSVTETKRERSEAPGAVYEHTWTGTSSIPAAKFPKPKPSQTTPIEGISTGNRPSSSTSTYA